MSLKVGIIGLANVGKSTLFNALVGSKKADVSDYPFCTIEPNKGIVEIPDKKLKQVASTLGPKNVIHAPLEFVDIAGLIKGAHKGEGLGNEFLSHIQEVDLLCQVLPFYREDEDPKEHKRTVLTELILKDLHYVNQFLESSDLDEEEREVLKIVKEELSNEKPVISQDLNSKEREALARFNLLTAKKIFYIANISESNLENEENISNSYIPISAKTEEDLIDLEDMTERAEYKQALGIKEEALDRIISKAYRLLSLISFYTIKQEVNQIQAWPIEKGSSAKEAAGLIHTDFAKDFVKAQIVSQKDLVKAGSFKKAGEKGLIKIKGEQYPVKDGEVINFVTSK